MSKFNKPVDFSLPMLLCAIVISSFIVSCHTEAAEKQCLFVSQLSHYQQEVLYKAYHAGLPYDLGLTAVAVAYHESNLGLYKARYNVDKSSDISFGVMHTAAKWKVKEMTPFEAGIWVEKMITIDDYSIQVGVQDLLYWQQRANGNWLKGLAMYNGGSKPNYSYAHEIAKVVNILKSCNL